MASNINTSAMKAVKDALKVLFFMLQHNLALDLFSSLIDLCINVGAQDLPKLRLAKYVTYSSWDTVHDLLNILKPILLTNMNMGPH
jgi:DNA polymerase sigma